MAVALTPLAAIALRTDPIVVQRVERIVPGPVLPLNDAMRDDFPISWATGGTARLRKFGTQTLVGHGPASAEVTVFDGEREIAKTRTDAKGFWRETVNLDKPGLKSFSARFRRRGIGSGRTAFLSATILDPNAKSETDISITNLTANDRVVAGFFTLRGSAPPGDFVQVYIDATYIGRAEVDLAGRWSYKPKISGGGRRTFTIVDEITERQFGPLPVIVEGKATPVKKPVVKKSAARPPIPGKKFAKPLSRVKPVAKRLAVKKAKPAPKKMVVVAKSGAKKPAIKGVVMKKASVKKPPAKKAPMKKVSLTKPAIRSRKPVKKGFNLTATPVTPARPLN